MTKHIFSFHGKGLSVAQPWASAIAFAGKDIENRSWQTHYRGPLAVHASGSLFMDGLMMRMPVIGGGRKKPLIESITKGRKKFGFDSEDDSVIQSHVVAIAMLADCVNKSSSPWYGREWGWVLQGVIPIVPIPWVGGLGIWDCKFKYEPLKRHR